MNLQYLFDSAGNTTGVFIPIEEWNTLKKKYMGIDDEVIAISSWQVDEVKDRLVDYRKNPNQRLDFDSAMADIEKDL
ncbi:hypothetical protein [Williamwhitmania taraxaci]|uniref:Addiction module component n=1 Tax=Williamwhitmania taraxaci TaxID=1640674 RepID=A0A1G6GUA9_9BACT|nr:hypothetical protein [Williamwhitmania taraxaci]SDB85554.1 hypothetical protein SAMN05216323_100431 [Williamwhitmania taraxaci]